MTTKIDYKRKLDCYKAKRGAFQIVTVPDLQYLMIDGHGDPNTAAFAAAATTLYPVAYKLKFASKKALDRDYVVMPLEGCGGPTTWSPSPTPATRHSGTGLS